MYRITWHPKALAELVVIEMDLEDDLLRAATASVVLQDIENELATRPLIVGVPRSSIEHRFLILDPLGVEFLVEEEDRIVVVFDVTYFGNLPDHDRSP